MEKYIHGGRVYDSTGKAENFLDFSANINPLGMPAVVRETILKNIDGIVNYPDADAGELTAAIFRKYDIRRENLILLNGAAEFFYLYLNTIRPKKVLIPEPAFSEYERAANAAGCEVKFFFTRPEENFRLDVDEIIRCVKSENIDCVIVGRPNNPTGAIISPNDVKKIGEVTKILIDESFVDFIEKNSVRNLISENISVVQSLTKIFAIPGLRLGFAAAEKKLAEKLNFGKDVWNVNFLSQKAGVAALDDEKFLKETRARIKSERKIFVERLKKIPGVKYFDAPANFILLKFDSIEIAEKILDEMRRKKILLRNCANFPGLDGSYLRSAIRLNEENKILLDRLEKILKTKN